MANRVQFDTLRSLSFSGISASYAAIGTPTTVTGRIMCITNTTDGDLIVSTDATNSTGELILIAGTFKLFDLTTNRMPREDDLALPIGTQFYVKQATAPTQGAIYVEIVYS